MEATELMTQLKLRYPPSQAASLDKVITSIVIVVTIVRHRVSKRKSPLQGTHTGDTGQTKSKRMSRRGRKERIKLTSEDCESDRWVMTVFEGVVCWKDDDEKEGLMRRERN